MFQQRKEIKVILSKADTYNHLNNKPTIATRCLVLPQYCLVRALSTQWHIIA